VLFECFFSGEGGAKFTVSCIGKEDTYLRHFGHAMSTNAEMVWRLSCLIDCHSLASGGGEGEV
jgi:hypothetical protein